MKWLTELGGLKIIIFVLVILAGRVIPESKENSTLFPPNTSWNQSERNIAMLTEQWKPIKGYEGRYEVSNFGRVKSLHRVIERSNGYVYTTKEKILKTPLDAYGYKRTYLTTKHKPKFCWIHRLVWDHFGDRPRDGHKLQVDHIDNNALNNRIDNLQLLTNRQNTSKSKLLTKQSGLPTCVCKTPNGKYRVVTQIGGKMRDIGRFNSIEEATSFYQKETDRL